MIDPPMPPNERLDEELEAETRAFLDAADRIARDDADWGVYREGEPRPKMSWWRRLLGFPPP